MSTSCQPSAKRLCKYALPFVLAIGAACGAKGTESSDPLLDLLIQKGMLTREEAERVRTEAEAARATNMPPMPQAQSKWKISNAIKNIELFGDIRLRYEHRQANTPTDSRIELDRGRAAVRLGLRGDAADDFYYGVRLETSSNPRSPWITFGQASSATSSFEQNSPFSKANTGINVGQLYLGWRPESWVDLTVGKMPNPLYTTPMVWDPDLNPEGAAERFKYTVGQADFFANFGQFLYEDPLQSFISGSLVTPVYGSATRTDSADTTFLLAWQGGVNYHFTTNVTAKIAPVIYQYIGVTPTAANWRGGLGDPFIGEPLFDSLTTYGGNTYNQIGINHLLVLEIPVEVNFKISSLNARVFGDYACNLEGADRARAAANEIQSLYNTYLSSVGTYPTPSLSTAGPQTDDIHAYQAGFAIGNKDSLGLVYGTTSKKHAWEFRTYWQHVEQYALDPNLLDSDFFEGRGNLQGIYSAFAYGITDNVIGTVRYGYAWRINDKLGSGGSNSDIPQLNPIDTYNLLQLDLTLRF